MKVFAVLFILISYLGLNVTFVWMVWSDSQAAGKAAFTALIVFINALLICLAMIE
ncbi:hypothetical protein [Limosilactobacillus allomucosae]|uniref:hypothetical protein n=1 Tax=Limosilactobacillus allomucosae TaxID=3142938 RepID=UPI003262F187